MKLNSRIFEIKNLTVVKNKNKILKNLNLKVNKGEIHVIMGPNGSGKSTLSNIIVNSSSINILNGDILLKGSSILKINSKNKSHLGIFLAFQYPIEIPGVSNEDFLRFIYNSKQKFYNKSEVDPVEFLSIICNKLKFINMSSTFLSRNVNEGFSGGEKKRNEILQMVLLDSEICILDEIDSGLDIDALKVISSSINNFMNEHKALIIVTHYRRLLEYIKPTYIHIINNGKIIKTGYVNLVKKLERRGYRSLKNFKIKKYIKNFPKN